MMLDKLFTDPNTARVLDYFLFHEYHTKWRQPDHCFKDLCEDLRIYPRDLKPILAKLTELGVITKTRTIARSDFYQINKQSHIPHILRVLVLELTLIATQ